MFPSLVQRFSRQQALKLPGLAASNATQQLNVARLFLNSSATIGSAFPHSHNNNSTMRFSRLFASGAAAGNDKAGGAGGSGKKEKKQKLQPVFTTKAQQQEQFQNQGTTSSSSGNAKPLEVDPEAERTERLQNLADRLRKLDPNFDDDGTLRWAGLLVRCGKP